MDELALARIRLVSRYYPELRGLMAVVIGCAFCIAATVASFELPSAYTAAFIMAIFVASLFIAHWLDSEYYPRRFGRVEQASDANWPRWLWFAATMAGCVFDRHMVGNGLPGLVMLFLAVYTLWIVVRDWPLRSYYVVVVVAGIMSSLLFARTTRETESAWFVATGMLFGISYIIAGVGDHRLLTLTLDNPEAHLERSSDEQSI